MKTAVLIPGFFPGYEHNVVPDSFDNLKDELAALEKWSFGNVDVTGKIPIYISEGHSEVLGRLNALPTKANYKFAHDGGQRKRHDNDPVLMYGRGSMGPHRDNVSGLCILTLLGSFSSDPKDYMNRPQYHERDGVFYQGKMIELRPGQSILFDDREEHAWIHNAWWVFSSIPVIRTSLPKEK